MLKIKYKKKLNEDFLKHSATAQKDIAAYVTQNYLAKTDGRQVFEVPLKEVIYDKPNILLGLPFLYYANLTDGALPNSEIEKNWDSEKKQFNKEFIDDLLNKNIKIPVRIINNPEGVYNAALRISMRSDKTSSLLVFVFNRAKIPRAESIINITRHELQHLTQQMNHFCILYSESLSKAKSIRSVKKKNFVDKNIKALKFGLGADKTGTKYGSVESDSEFENHMTDLVYSLYRRIDKNKLQDRIKANGANAAAVYYIKDTFDKFYTTKEKDYDGLQKLLARLIKVRPKELPKDMLKLLEKLISA